MQRSRIKGVSCLLDTDIVIDFLRKREYARKLLEIWMEDGLLAISTLTHLEVYQGMRASEEKATNVFLDGVISIPVDVAIARRAGKILGELRAGGKTIGAADAIIGATALELNTTLLTNNIEHYSFSDLHVIRGFPESQQV